MGNRKSSMNGNGSSSAVPPEPERISSSIHPNHELSLLKAQDPFYCSACKEVGFGSSYGCNQCVFRVHRHCIHTSGQQSSSNFGEFRQSFNSKRGIICTACLNPMNGCGYRKKLLRRRHFHVTCQNLDSAIEVNKEQLKLKRKNIKVLCGWCKKKDSKSWSYRPDSGKSPKFHVACMKEMMVESWKNEKLILDGEAVVVSMEIKLPDPDRKGFWAKMGRFAWESWRRLQTADTYELLA